MGPPRPEPRVGRGARVRSGSHRRERTAFRSSSAAASASRARLRQPSTATMRRRSRRPDAYMYVRSTLASWSSMAAISAPRGRPSAWKRRALPCRRTSALGSVAVDYGLRAASPARMMTLETRFPPTAIAPSQMPARPGMLRQPATRATHRRLAHRPRRRSAPG